MTKQLDSVELANINLYISSLEASIKFYTDILGFKIIAADMKRVKLSASGLEPAQIVLNRRDDAIDRPYKTTGLYHLAIRLPNRLELAKLLRHILKHHWPLYGLSDHTVSEAIYLCDPDEIGIELYADKDPEADYSRDLHLAMETTALRAQDLLDELEGNVYCWDGIHSDTDIGHIHLQVSNLQRAKSFYCDLLGFRVTQESYPGAIFLAAGGYHHHIAVNVWGSEAAKQPPINSVGMKSYLITVNSTEVIENIVKALEEVNYQHKIVKFADYHILHVQDPDGHLVEIMTK